MFNAQSGAVRTLAANMKFSMHSGGKAARAQIFREFSRSGKLAGLEYVVRTSKHLIRLQMFLRHLDPSGGRSFARVRLADVSTVVFYSLRDF